jgi:hypothetical protein
MLGGIPFELATLWNQPEERFKEKIQSYRENRINDIAVAHGKFCDTLSKEKMANLKECISRMALGLNPPNLKVGMHYQIFDIVKDNSGQKLIISMNPVARDALIAYHGVGLLSNLRMVAELVLENPDYTNDMKGRILEKYVITEIEICKRFSFLSRKKIQQGMSTASNKQTFQLQNIIHFGGQNLPSIISRFNKKLTTLFIPDSSNYPGFDFFIWDPQALKILGFQVTVVNPFIKHSKIDVFPNCISWVEFCGTENAMDIYWIIPGACVPNGYSKKAVGHSVILFEELQNDYPALSKLKI